MGDTSIRVSDELADELHDLKNRGDSYEDVIWRLMEGDGDDEPAPSERRDFAVSDEPVPTAGDESQSDSGSRAGRGDDESNPVSERKQAEKRIQELGLAGKGAAYSIRANAVLRMYDHLRENPGDRVDKDDLRGLLEGEDVGYKGGFASLWSNWVKKNESQGRPSNTLSELPGVEMRGDEYVYTNESV